MQVLVVDDQSRARQSLKALLATCCQIEVHEATNGPEAIALVSQVQPDIVLMDVRMPGMDGLEATRCIKAAWPQIKVIILSMYNEYANEALTVGADAFVSKGEPPQTLLNTLMAMTS